VNQVSVYPNPGEKTVSVNTGDLKDASIKLYNGKGQILLSRNNVEASILEFSLPREAGFYFLEVEKDGVRSRHKISAKGY
jgi:hypothetical protein